MSETRVTYGIQHLYRREAKRKCGHGTDIVLLRRFAPDDFVVYRVEDGQYDIGVHFYFKDYPTPHGAKAAALREYLKAKPQMSRISFERRLKLKPTPPGLLGRLY